MLIYFFISRDARLLGSAQTRCSLPRGPSETAGGKKKETFNEILSAVTELMAFACPNTNIRLVFPSEKKRSFTKHSRKPVKETQKVRQPRLRFGVLILNCLLPAQTPSATAKKGASCHRSSGGTARPTPRGAAVSQAADIRVGLLRSRVPVSSDCVRARHCCG